MTKYAGPTVLVAVLLIAPTRADTAMRANSGDSEASATEGGWGAASLSTRSNPDDEQFLRDIQNAGIVAPDGPAIRVGRKVVDLNYRIVQGFGVYDYNVPAFVQAAMNAYQPGEDSTEKSRKRIIEIPATQAWKDTGLYVQPGQEIHVTAKGAIGIAYNDPYPKAPDGDPGCTAQGAWAAPGLPCWSLIGRVGDGPLLTVGQEAFITGEGKLYLGINDEVATFGDNSGSWTASIEVAD